MLLTVFPFLVFLELYEWFIIDTCFVQLSWQSSRLGIITHLKDNF